MEGGGTGHFQIDIGAVGTDISIGRKSFGQFSTDVNKTAARGIVL